MPRIAATGSSVAARNAGYSAMASAIRNTSTEMARLRSARTTG